MSDLKDYLYEHVCFSDVIQQEAGVKKKDGLQKDDKKNLFDGAVEDDYRDLNSAKRFDQLDFIIIDVPSNYLPWQEKSY